MNTVSPPDSVYRLYLNREERGYSFDSDSLRSFVPSVIADKITSLLPGNAVLDAFCGVGGNSISFARAGRSVIGVDLDNSKLASAKFNAGLAGVGSKIIFVNDSALNQIYCFDGDAIYLDPPWGGSSLRVSEFQWDHFALDVPSLIHVAVGKGIPIAVKLPQNFDDDAMTALVPRSVVHQLFHPRFPQRCWVKLAVIP